MAYPMDDKLQIVERLRKDVDDARTIDDLKKVLSSYLEVDLADRREAYDDLDTLNSDQ